MATYDSVRFPVSCPACAEESLSQLPLITIANALRNGERLHLSAECHHRTWEASELEMAQIREYLRAALSVE
jgi:hypothetical protein